MSIKMTIDLTDATFAETTAALVYINKLGIDPDQRLEFDGSVIKVEFESTNGADNLNETLIGQPSAPQNAEQNNSQGHANPTKPEYSQNRSEDNRNNTQAPINVEEVVDAVGSTVNDFLDNFFNNGGSGRGYRGGPGSFGPFGPNRRRF